jgi:microcystin-dependent protein
MTNYTQSTNFATKDALTSGNPLKIVKGTEINTEFANIAIAVATKADLASPTFTGTPSLPTGTTGVTQSYGTSSTALATTAFVQGAILTGEIKMWGTATAPSGYLLCIGTAVSRTTYAALFAIYSTTFGSGDGSTTFNLPDFRDRMPIGAGTTYSAADTGGSATTTLQIANLPAHTHANTLTDNGHSHGVVGGLQGTSGSQQYIGGNATPSTSTSAASTGITITNASVGSGTAATTISPYLGIYFIIKT